MGYTKDLQTLLEPLGVYRLEAGLSGAELSALGTALDHAEQSIERTLREGILATAEAEGLRRWELLLHCAANGHSVAQRRQTLTALLQIRESDITPDDFQRAVDGCGISARVSETAQSGVIQVDFPQVAGVPADFAQIQSVLEEILPPHLQIRFLFHYQTWRLCEERGTTWRMVEDANTTWHQWERQI